MTALLRSISSPAKALTSCADQPSSICSLYSRKGKLLHLPGTLYQQCPSAPGTKSSVPPLPFQPSVAGWPVQLLALVPGVHRSYCQLPCSTDALCTTAKHSKECSAPVFSSVLDFCKFNKQHAFAFDKTIKVQKVADFCQKVQSRQRFAA